jgi:hypothetical protein
METGLTEDKREHVGEIDTAGTSRDCSGTQRVNCRWGSFAPMLVLAFVAVISSCDQKTGTEKRAEVNRLQLIPEHKSGTFDKSTEILLQDPETAGSKITAAEADRRQENRFGREPWCRVDVSEDMKTKEKFVSISVPVYGTTFEDRKRLAERAETRKQLEACYNLFGIELHPSLAPSSNSPCIQKKSGSCDYDGSEGCCQG